METRMHESMIKLHTHTHTHICYKIVAEHSCYAKISKNGNKANIIDKKINKSLVNSG